MKAAIAPTPVLVHPRLSSISTDFHDFLERMNFYASNIAKITNNPNFKLILLLGSDNLRSLQLSDFSNLCIYRVMKPTFNYSRFARQSIRLLNENKHESTLLIAGDLTIGLLASVAIKSKLIRKIPIQVSVHGSIYKIGNNSKISSRIKVRKMFIRFMFSQVQSFRVVSPSVRNELLMDFGIDQEKIFIAPIPFVNYPCFEARKDNHPSIGVIGRLHPERNVGEALSILNFVVRHQVTPKVFIVGGGPLEKEVRSWAKIQPHEENIQITGSISHAEVISMLPSIDIILSTAEKEGYGLTIREAILSGAVVVARRNAGTEEVVKIFKKGIYLYETLTEAVKILEFLITGGLVESVCSNGREMQQEIDLNSLENLARSWSKV
jgi:glycosyltransferase involved in cell wall biosynthesis